MNAGTVRPNSPDEIIALMEAYKKGELIEYSYVHATPGRQIAVPSWNFSAYAYRVKPLPFDK